MAAATKLRPIAKKAANLLGYSDLRPSQEEAICNFVSGKDIFVSLPTGSGKSLCYFVLPAMFNELLSSTASIAVVISPLTALMREQVQKLLEKGATAVYVGDLPSDDHSSLHKGEYQFVFMSPESLLTNPEWRDMIASQHYQDNAIALVVDEAHCVKQWGESFRTEFSKIGEVRSLLPNVRIMALTATATKSSRNKICKSLGMINPVVVSKSPNRPNIHLSVESKQDSIEDHFGPLVEEIRQKRKLFDRTIIFCHSFDDCSSIYIFIRKSLGLEGTEPVGAPDLVRYRLVDMFSSCTEKEVKKSIQQAFSEPGGSLRLIIATIAFGMGLDCPDIRQVFHWGPSGDVESYIQEVGRGGRDGQPAVAILFYATSDFKGPRVDELMREYCKNGVTCRRELLFKHFDNFDLKELSLNAFYCCDICDQNMTL